ncbi:helix-turn-helix domain-containing protein [Streptomyces sp. NPDC051219]|uniref:helix-turn-helix domain-containing protein n=1 Tax=Streptomyces sp. NPDC051219 TaxID=3155283 RepID=UPI00341D319F
MEKAAETRDFADCLRGLKERAGLSYGTLARRLHVSTSTLHRYCNGDAVPVEFATVDRFGRQCGASPQEMVDLHRRWLLADAQRVRDPARGSVADAVRAPEAGPERGVARAAPQLQAVDPQPEHVGDPEVGTPPQAVPAPAPEPGGQSSPEPSQPPATWPGPPTAASPGPQSGSGPQSESESASGAGSGAHPTPATGSPAGGEGAAKSGVEATVRSVPGAGSSPARRWVGRRHAALAAAVCALVAAVVAVDLATGSSADPARGTARGTGASSGPGSGPGSSPGRSVGPPAATPVPTGTTTTTEPADGQGSAPGRTPRPPAPAATPPTGRPPLTWAARSHVWQHGCDHSYLIDRGPKDVPAPPVEQDASAWAAAQRAVHGGQTVVEITVQGDAAEPAVLQALQVRVAGRRAPLPWNVYTMSQGCGGVLTPASFAVNLDVPRPLARPVAGFDGEKALPAVTFPFRVSSTDPVVLRVETATSRCDCDWYLELVWTRSGRSGTTRIDDGGRPFRTSAAKGRPEYGYAQETGRWATDQGRHRAATASSGDGTGLSQHLTVTTWQAHRNDSPASRPRERLLLPAGPDWRKEAGRPPGDAARRRHPGPARGIRPDRAGRPGTGG